MKHLVLIRKYILDFYQNHEEISNYIFRFLFSLLSIISVNLLLGYNPLLKQWYMVLPVSFIFSFLPISLMILMIPLYAAVNVYYVSVALSALIAVVFILLYLTYLRLDVKFTFIIPLILVMHMLHLKVLVPIILGLFFEPVTVVPMVCGIFVQYLFSVISDALSGLSVDTGIVYSEIIGDVFNNTAMYEEAIVFIIVLLLVYFIKKMGFDYANLISVLIGNFVGMTLFLIINYFFEIDFNLFTFFIESIISIIIGILMQFMYTSLNYTATERLTFEDDEYVYYVKAVPKNIITVEERNIKRFKPGRIRLRRAEYFRRPDKDEKKIVSGDLDTVKDLKDIKEDIIGEDIIEEVTGKDPVDTRTSGDDEN